MSVRSAGGGRGKKVRVKVLTLSSCVAARPSSSVGMRDDVATLKAYFLIWNMLLPSVPLTYSFHFILFALAIPSWYSFLFTSHASLSMGLCVCLYKFLSLFACRR